MSRRSRPLMRASGALLIASTLVAASVAPAGAVPGRGHGGSERGRADYTLTVLHSNDGESKLLGAPADADYGGAARFTSLLHQLRDEERSPRAALPGEARRRGVVTVSSGDVFLSGPQFAASQQEDAPFYDALAAGYADYDAISMGNHEFDLGPDTYAEFIEATPGDAPFLVSNMDVSGEPGLAELEEKGRIAPSTVVKQRGERIGIVGAITPLLPSISSPRNAVVDTDVRGAVQDEVDALTTQGIDKIIVISHLQGIGEDKKLARKLRDVDVMVAGGGHETQASEGTPLVPDDVVPNDPETGEPLEYPLWVADSTGTEVPIVTAGSDYKYVGRLVVNFDKQGKVTSAADRSAPVRVSGVGDDAVEPDPDVYSEVHKPVEDYVAGLAESTAATTDVGLDGRRDPGVRTGETNLGNLLADALLATGRANAATYGVPEPQIALQNGGGIRNNSVIGPGKVSELDTYTIAPFPNQVVVVPDLPRAQIKELLENGVSSMPAADGRFAQVAGMDFTYDAARTAQQVDDDGNVLQGGERVRDLVLHDGTVIVSDGEVVDGPPITVATIDFSARGGDQWPFRGADYTVVGANYQTALFDYLTKDLGGQVTAADYPEGGSGRITPVG
ncbi:bifunctional metallophosphatase/5'-nucleotidase [Nocardiopsis gilva YIM 90087]|uniref:Bifunctional metallophosphatase/5'-nucleotidase n=1 Tax=Nocardiopsis gilva YIM 90087 TaxID=1235441 RepID=A0A223S3B2_9ACTN|nr:5'-nucleotidase C-terminal domain-containing protein [Nocardiopsis gilva]ASU82626.1 bifunctional metallophosphatase/5'-nucleotidase [Nocardiopsis gilva YIM 90087]